MAAGLGGLQAELNEKLLPFTLFSKQKQQKTQNNQIDQIFEP